MTRFALLLALPFALLAHPAAADAPKPAATVEAAK